MKKLNEVKRMSSARTLEQASRVLFWSRRTLNLKNLFHRSSVFKNVFEDLNGRVKVCTSRKVSLKSLERVIKGRKCDICTSSFDFLKVSAVVGTPLLVRRINTGYSKILCFGKKKILLKLLHQKAL